MRKLAIICNKANQRLLNQLISRYNTLQTAQGSSTSKYHFNVLRNLGYVLPEFLADNNVTVARHFAVHGSSNNSLKQDT